MVPERLSAIVTTPLPMVTVEPVDDAVTALAGAVPRPFLSVSVFDRPASAPNAWPVHFSDPSGQ